MTTKATGSNNHRGLRTIAGLQAIAIAVLAIVALRDEDIAPPEVPTTAPTARAAATANAATATTSSPQPASGSSAVPDAPTSTPPDRATAPSGTVLFGQVANASGEAVANSVVWFRRDEDSKAIATISSRPGNSTYAIAGLSPGRITYQTRATGYKERRGSIDIPADLPRLRYDIELEPAWLLTVKIQTPEGEPLHLALQKVTKDRSMLHHVEVCAVVTASRPEADFPPTPYREVSLGLGRWQSATGISARVRDGAQQPKDVAGTIEIDERQPLWVTAVMRHRVLASAQVEPGQGEVVLTVPLQQVLQDLCSIRGRVVDAADGTPVANAAIGFGDLQGTGSAGKSDADGHFEVRHLRPGLLDVEIRGASRMARRDLVLLQPGQTLDIGDVPIFEFRQIKGRCEGLMGKPEDCSISWTSLEVPTHPAVRRYTDSTRVAADGTFTLNLPDGPYRLRASGSGGALTEIDTRTLGDQPLVLQLAPEANVRLDVQSNGEPWELAMFDSKGREVYRRALQHGWQFALRFLPGDYRAELTDRHGTKHTRQIHLGADGVDLPVR